MRFVAMTAMDSLTHELLNGFSSLSFRRLYHYATTNLPMPPHAIIEESTEDKVDPPWLMTKICRMLDEFSDVNAGEKEFMKMWNLHVQHFT